MAGQATIEQSRAAVGGRQFWHVDEVCVDGDGEQVLADAPQVLAC
jgi:hypothetical protein